jgi:hypothetical protein
LNFSTDFNQQFLLVDKEVTQLSDWRKEQIGKYTLYAHPTLCVTSRTGISSTLTVLGDFYDFRNPERANSETLNAFAIDCSMDVMLNQLQFLSGIYLVVWHTRDGLFLIPDMCALREAYVWKKADSICAIGSTLTILRAVGDLNPDLHDFYASDLFKRRYVWVGDKTSYREVTRLKPNHYLRIDTGEVRRFFPVVPVQELELLHAVKEVSAILPGILRSILHREEKLMIGLTAGWDSRLLLAASKAFTSRLVYFVNIYPGSPDYDHRIPMQLAAKLNLTFLTVHLGADNNAEQESIVATFPSGVRQNAIRIIGFKKLFRMVKSVSGSISEIARNEFGLIEKLSGVKLSALAKFEDHAFCVAEYNEWLHKNQPVFSRFGYNTLDMFYWEEVVANRMGKSTTDCHALHHSILPVFNCRYLMNTMLGVNVRHRDKQNHVLYLELIRALWPEVLSEPINPGIKKRIIRLMQKVKLYNVYRSIFSTGIVTPVRHLFTKNDRSKY